jgi:hypothetical protein
MGYAGRCPDAKVRRLILFYEEATKWKSEVKRAALSQLGLDPYSSRMFFDHHFRNVESKSYTATILIMYL